MGLDQILMVTVVGLAVLLDMVNTRALRSVPGEDRAILAELLKRLWLGTALLVAALVVELGRVLLGIEDSTAAITPLLIGFAANLVTILLRYRAYRTYELAANKPLGRALRIRAMVVFSVTTFLWYGLSLARS